MSISVNAGYKGWLPNAGFRPLSKVTLMLFELAMNYSALNQDRKGTIHPQIEYTTVSLASGSIINHLLLLVENLNYTGGGA